MGKRMDNLDIKVSECLVFFICFMELPFHLNEFAKTSLKELQVLQILPLSMFVKFYFIYFSLMFVQGVEELFKF